MTVSSTITCNGAAASGDLVSASKKPTDSKLELSTTTTDELENGSTEKSPSNTSDYFEDASPLCCAENNDKQITDCSSVENDPKDGADSGINKSSSKSSSSSPQQSPPISLSCEHTGDSNDPGLVTQTVIDWW
ncbi:hypothetical protein Ciccas_005221 [Cichlidogyrus casuarinus]|uniref:Uncharacterized protein n=1 Tax=Cichlidogyrus casuarinus TaxID=1844966 RepID=A0ABD2Q9Q7_9PLAT